MDDEVDGRGPTVAQPKYECRQSVDKQQRVGHRPGERHRMAVVCVTVDTLAGNADGVEGPEDNGDEHNDARQHRLDVLEPRQLGSGPHPSRRAAGEDGQ